MLNDTLIEMIQAQSAREALARHTYQSRSLWCALQGYDGAQAWFAMNAAEEGEHLAKWLQFAADYADVQIPLPTVLEAQEQPGSLLEAFQDTLALELSVTEAINAIAAAGDETAQELEAFCQWFLLEQIASVSEIRTIVRWLERAPDAAGLFMADEKIGELAE